MKWWPIARRYPPSQPQQASEHLLKAYRNMFRPNSDDAQIVLSDLANFCGFYWPDGPGTDPHDRAFSDGKRAAFGRLFHFLNLTEEERAALAEAARAERFDG